MTLKWLVLASLLFPVYYLLASWIVSWRIALKAVRLRQEKAPHQ
jgi:hypothetical protein